ncbi:unnamed protein product [Durusdinium trenchii]|uniref:Uncharacterized protein n=1 Tax=Durusdinium trenchii TaxID=1381693 RepID=A0ABP0MCU2_9DINO
MGLVLHWLALTLAAANFKCTAGWNFWSSQHLHLQQRQQLEWQELTLMENESTGLTGGARLPFKELPTHYHPEPYGEIYHFTRGNGHVTLHEYTDWVNIPARMLHGIEAGSEGCEFLWMFPARRWKAIPYLYVDPTLPDRNVPDHWVAPLPLGADAATWAAMRHRAAATNGDAVHVEHRLLEGITSSRYPSNIALQKLTVWAEGWQGALELLLEARQRSVQTAIHPTVENLAEEARRGAEALRPFWDAAPSRRSLLARWSHALDLFFQEIQCGSPQTLEDYRAAIKACPRFYWKLCLHLLEQMKTSLGPDRLSYREAMRTCNRGLYSYEAALGLFEDMTVQQLEPTVEEHNEVLLAYITGNRWEEAFRHFAKMQSEGPPPNVQSYCMVLYACADSSEVTAWSSAIRYWSDMREDKITPDFDAYDMLLLVAERSERWDWSRQLLDTLFKLNAPYTVTMFNAALNAARRGKRWELAQSLIRDMSDELLLPTIVSYSFAVDACEKADRFDVATQLLESVDELDLKT